jgi:DNA-directed RNA polymerase specialized sigma24 family protein
MVNGACLANQRRAMAGDPARMRQILEELSQNERLICIWKLAGFSTRDIARHMQRPESDIDSEFADVNRKIRRLLREQDDGG